MVLTADRKFFKVDARTILQLGRQSIKDHTTALIELVKNAYDADANDVEIQIHTSDDLIRIADNGVGMDEGTFERTWLRIGYSAKRRTTRSPSGRRRVVGEKGVGRISADRIGAELELRTLATSKKPFAASVSWDAFDVEGKDLQSVPVQVLRGIEPVLPHRLSDEGKKQVGNRRPHGTELLIRHLRQVWTADDVDTLVRELETLLSPFHEDSDLRIWVSTDIHGAFSGLVQSTLQEQAELEITAKLFRNQIRYEITDRSGVRAKKRKGTIHWKDVGNVSVQGRAAQRSKSARTGPVEVRLFYFPQRFFRERGSVLGSRELRDRTVGVRIYRDKVRVRPYGDMKEAEGDWLGLASRKAREPAGVSRIAYRVPPTELAGAVFITRDRNRRLQDSAGREGLVHNEAFGDLRALVTKCLRLLETYRHRTQGETERAGETTPILSAIETYAGSLSGLEREWQEIRKQAPSDPVRAFDRAEQAISNSIDSLRSTRASINTLVEQTRLFRGLSSLGIAASVFGHETQTAITMCLANLGEARDELGEKQPDLALASKAVEKALGYGKKVSAWGSFAVARVRYEKRKPKTVRVDVIVTKLVDELRPAFAATNTELSVAQEATTIRAHPMDLEAIAVNLLTNAYTFAQDSRKQRAIRIVVKNERREGKPGALLIVADSGPGVTADSREVIWEPLYTSKRDAAGNEIGTGLGLAIIDSIVQDAKGSRAVDADPVLKGARFSIWLPAE